MGQPLSLSLSLPVLYVNATPLTSAQLAQQVKPEVPQDNINNPTHMDWMAQSASRRTALEGLGGQAAMLEASNKTSQSIRSQLNETFSQYQNGSTQFQCQKAIYEHSRVEENKRNASLGDRLKSSSLSLTVYRPSEGGLSPAMIPASSAVDTLYVTVKKSPPPVINPLDTSRLIPISKEPAQSFSKTQENGLTRNETIILANSYYTVYLKQAIEGIPASLEGPIVFQYNGNLPLNLPPMPGVKHEGFVFKGSLADMDDKTYHNILKGKYVYCPNQLHMTRKGEPNHPRKIDVIITGTTAEKCGQFGEHFLRSAAICSAGADAVDTQDFYSKTPIFKYAEQKFEETGTLATIPEVVKEEILLGNFTACNTSHSSIEDKDSGAIVIGIRNQDVCPALSVHQQESIIAQTNSQK